MSADWKRIETEYITTDTSYRKLAEKYGLNQATIATRAKKENWVGKREQQAITTQAKMLESDIETKVDRVARLKTVGDKILDKVEYLVDATPLMTPAALKNLSETLRNIQQAQMIRTERDDREQDARIAKLQKEAQKEDKNNAITVVLEGDLKKYAQ